MEHIIIGAGHVANALKPQLKGNVNLYDKGEWEDIGLKCDICHIAIPYNNFFNGVCRRVKEDITADRYIIHSTVQPGTSRDLDMIYSPVQGREADTFYKNITLYTKHIACSEYDFMYLEDAFKINIQRWEGNSYSLEYAKIMSTAYMYWNLLFQKIMFKDCEEHGMNFDMVYKLWNLGYNAGIRINHANWQRPIYSYDENPIPGGHCLSSNVYLFDNLVNNLCRYWQETEGQIDSLSDFIADQVEYEMV